MVNERNREELDEVSNRRLTSMALDVSRGLSYLAELKYVHRDIACRNCLVNSTRVVKLADFGMTRPMYENDYYRFSRKGMLPVRWMAPESLGMFSNSLKSFFIRKELKFVPPGAPILLDKIPRNFSSFLIKNELPIESFPNQLHFTL